MAVVGGGHGPVACLKGVLVVNPERGAYRRVDVHQRRSRWLVSEVVRLRTTIAQAIADLGPHTMVHNYDSGDECDDCCDDWPCRYARVADDLRKAIEP